MPERILRAVRPALLHPRVQLAVKSGIAAGIAWTLGNLLPGEIGDYGYYASLGAISALYPAVSDTVRESVRTTAAILLGAVLAAGVQVLAWANGLTVGAVVLVAVLVAGLPFLGAQRTWVATAALFVLVFSGDPPQDYILAYVLQILLGAGVGLAVNALVPSLNLTSLGRSVERLRWEVVRQVRGLAEVLGKAEDPCEDDLETVFDRIDEEREGLQTALAQVERSRQFNPRARRHSAAWQALRERGLALARVGFLVQNVGVVLEGTGDGERLLDDALRRSVGRVLADLASLLEDPSEECVDAVEDGLAGLLTEIADAPFDTDEQRYLAGVVAASVRLAVSSVTAHLVPSTAS
jgi:uncharacterized membrane protein YgaE (UPF0421/DUF939 family)